MNSKSPLADSPFEQLEKNYKIDSTKTPPFQDQENEPTLNRNPASHNSSTTPNFGIEEMRSTVFADLKRLENALVTNNHEVIQDLLPKFDSSIDRLIEVRTIIGSTINKIDNTVNSIEKEELINESYKSKIEDADVAELFTDLTRQQNVLNATYKSSAQMMNNSLMKFIN